MASVDFQKIKNRTTAAAMFSHCLRESRTHSNPDIDMTKSDENINIDGFDKQGCIERFKNRIKALDETTNKNKRKDRVELFGLTVPACDGMSKSEAERFLDAVYKKMVQAYGRDNVVNGFIHFDEVHEYYDKAKGDVVTSRPHLHVYVVPEIDGQLNGKKFSSRARMREINKWIDCYARETYGIEFMTGGKHRDASVEDLKLVSKSAEQERLQEVDKQRKEIFANDEKIAEQQLTFFAQQRKQVMTREQAIKGIEERYKPALLNKGCFIVPAEDIFAMLHTDKEWKDFERKRDIANEAVKDIKAYRDNKVAQAKKIVADIDERVREYEEAANAKQMSYMEQSIDKSRYEVNERDALHFIAAQGLQEAFRAFQRDEREREMRKRHRERAELMER